mmetsp:Transcript_36980/g.54294  ORF Transcript_36980/g.54294 Transcript_36980/m.54294 type:complete len:914 (-) Transcript_36980:222-2963(-)|eukprot:CAMPEP_0195526502 /NCGR_PEP_ID=MMETSP0794_2-20130614/27604_1 /TAXON_ID=515487 /ORGANISM="Stephanopyxis turris, Strain CCMP 815" /LENGTH=913 /DNA_ID=CAMNT_0040657199 /DNA_START=29 /DNA_END=2770 /DNA_ORIENTATION=+
MWGNLLANVPGGDVAKERIAAALERTGDMITEVATDHVSKQRNSTAGTDGSSQGGSASTSESATSSPKESKSNEETSDSPKRNPFTKERWGSILESTRKITTSVIDSTKHQIQQQHEAFLHSTTPRNRRATSLPLDTEALRDAEVVYITDRLITMGHPAMQSSSDGDITPIRKLAAVGQLLEKRHGGRYMVWNLSEVEYDYGVLNDQVLAYQFPGSPSPPLGLLLKLLFSMESWLKADSRNVAVLHCLTGKGRTSTVLAAFLCWVGEAGFDDPMRALEYIALCKRMDVESLTIPSQRRYVGYFSNMLDGVRPNQPPLLLKRIIMSEAPRFEKPPKDHPTPVTLAQPMGCSPYLQIFKAGQLVFTTAASLSHNQSPEDLPFCLPSDGPISFPIETVVQGDILIRCRHLSKKGQRVSMFRAAFHTGYTPPKVLRLSKAQLDGACLDERFEEGFSVDLIFEACDAETASMHLLPSSMDPTKQEDPNTNHTTNKHHDAAADKNKQQTVQMEGVNNSAAARRMLGTVAAAAAGTSTDAVNPSAALTASTYDSMLHRDARFWNVIANRRQENLTKLADIRSDGDNNKVSGIRGNDEDGGAGRNMKAGPTIGRRRDTSAMILRCKNAESSSESAKGPAGPADSADGAAANSVDKGSKKREDLSRMDSQTRQFEAFSIGGGSGWDFDDYDENSSAVAEHKTTTTNNTQQKDTDTAPSPKPKPAGKDELMEALMDIDDDDDDYQLSPSKKTVETEEIVFHDDNKEPTTSDSKEEVAPPPSTNQPTAAADDSASAPKTDQTDTTVTLENDKPTIEAAAAAAAAAPDAKKEEPTTEEKELIKPKDDTDTSSTPPVETQPKKETTTASKKEPLSDIIATADGENDDLGDLEDVVAGAGDGDEDFDFDDDDDDLADLENFLTQSGK